MAKQKLNPNECIITLEEKLSVEELEQCSARLANLVEELDDLKAEKSASAKSFNDQIESVQKSMTIVAEQVKTTIRKTEVLVTKKENRAEGVIEFVDANGTVVQRQPLLIEAGTQLHIEDQIDVVVEEKPKPEDYGFDLTTGKWDSPESAKAYRDAMKAWNDVFVDENNPPQAEDYGFDPENASWDNPEQEEAYQEAIKEWHKQFEDIS